MKKRRLTISDFLPQWARVLVGWWYLWRVHKAFDRMEAFEQARRRETWRRRARASGS